jgi:3-isopropylmalate dehydrogenase
LKRYRVATIPGDGIGPEVIDAAGAVLGAVARRFGFALDFERLPYSADHYLASGETLPDHAFQHLRDDVDAILLGAVGDPRVPGNEHARDILLGLRFRLDLYINLRPVKLLHPELTPLRKAGDRGTGGRGDGKDIDFVIFRENSEGVYLARGRIEGDEYVAEEWNTRQGVERIIRAAFEYAKKHGRRRVTMSDKANAVPAHRIWQESFRAIGADYPDIASEHRYVDALALELVREPERFEVIVTNNLFGDILSDLGAGLVGGLGLAASANLHPGRVGLFEPVHGSAPPLAGKNAANPFAAILTGAMMLEELGERDAARMLEHAVVAALAAGVRTGDIGGTTGTREAAAWVVERVTTHG